MLSGLSRETKEPCSQTSAGHHPTRKPQELKFRSDLYYRLNVFPVTLPPLRERRQDIPQLASHFVEICARRMGKQIDHIPQDMLAAFTSYSWPGNVRELQNLVERAVIRSNNGVPVNPLVVSEKLPNGPVPREARSAICSEL